MREECMDVAVVRTFADGGDAFPPFLSSGLAVVGADRQSNGNPAYPAHLPDKDLAMRRSRLLTVLLMGCSAILARAEKPEYRWVYLQTNLQVAENVDKVGALLERAEAAGYNGIVLADFKLGLLDRVPDFYFKNAAKFNQLAEKYHQEVIPCVASMGYSEALLSHNPNLAEGLPVKDVVFQVHGDTAWLGASKRAEYAGNSSLAPLSQPLPNGGFEEHKGNMATGWAFQDEPGKLSFIDQEVKHSGQSSLRFDGPGVKAAYTNARISRKLIVKPWHLYHARVWVKTDSYNAAHDTKIHISGHGGRALSFSNLGVKPTQDWTEHHVVFNSLDNTEVTFYIGTWGIRGGKIWYDDARVEEAAFVNLLRRNGCPLVVKDAGGQKYEEGRDFAELKDQKSGHVQWAGGFNVYHEPPALKILPNSRIKDGQELLVSYYHTVTIYDGQVSCCLGHPDVLKLVADQVSRVEKTFKPKRYFLSHDEIRVANWCESCNHEGRTAGALLAENMKHCIAAVRQVNPQAKLCCWSDMFDPAHNAVKDYYLVNGDYAGSWEGLPSDMLVMNWHSGKAAESLPFFGKRGLDQVLAGYYDSDPSKITAWMAKATPECRVRGVMYTTWQQNFKDLEAFAKAAWGNEK